MKLNHVANRIDIGYFEIIVDIFKSHLGFSVLRRTEKSIWMRQNGSNVDLQFTQSGSTNRDIDKRGSQVSFLSETPQADLEKLANVVRKEGLEATIGSWSNKEFFLDVPAAFVDFVIEAMTPEMAEYEVTD